MNESDTRSKKIDPMLSTFAGWGRVPESHYYTEQNVVCQIAPGRVERNKGHRKPLRMDYLLVYKGQKIGIVEAKSDEHDVSVGVEQAKKYAAMMNIRFTYSTNGNEIYQIDMLTGKEGLVDGFPTPQQLWKMTFPEANSWRDKFNELPFYKDDVRQPRYYQEIAVNKVLEAVAKKQNRILLTMATGTGKTFVSFQICWKLMQARWDIREDNFLPRILFLSDRNILSDQALTGFGGFQKEAMCRITPEEIKENEGVLPTGKSIYFTIFQTFMCKDENEEPYYKQYAKDFFDFIIIDECHRGGANDESRWRDILEYFEPAYQLGLTATPRRDANVNTYNYFGEPVYVYSLKQGISDGFLTPFRVKRINTDIDDYQYQKDDDVENGEIDPDKVYTEKDFYHGNIKMKQRDEIRVEKLMQMIDQNDKTLVFCGTQNHAMQIRDMINQHKTSTSPFYCMRVTAEDGAEGERQLKQFQDNEKTIPTILTTSRKLSTGVDARNVRNIVLMRPINDIVEFKQILGRGTRLFDDKYYFTIIDFVRASDKFNDVDWDGIPDYESDEDDANGNGGSISNNSNGDGGNKTYGGRDFTKVCSVCGMSPCVCEKGDDTIVVRLTDDRVIEIKSHIGEEELFMFGDELIGLDEFVKRLFGCLPKFFKSDEDLRRQWANPNTRRGLLEQLEEENFSLDKLNTIRDMLSMTDCDMIDVLEFLAYHTTPMERAHRVEIARDIIMRGLTEPQMEYVDFVLSHYISDGFQQLDSDNISPLLKLKYGTIKDAKRHIGDITTIQNLNFRLQSVLYAA